MKDYSYISRTEGDKADLLDSDGMVKNNFQDH